MQQALAASAGAPCSATASVAWARPRAAAAARPGALRRHAAAAGLRSGGGGFGGSGAAPQQQRRGRLLVTAAIKVVKGKQVLCSKTLQAKEGQEKKVWKMCQDVAAWSQEKAKDRQSGILTFQASQDDFEPLTFHFMELYDSNGSLGRHNTEERFQAFMEAVCPLLERPIGMVLYEYQGGQIGAPGMQGGPKGEGGLDDATGSNKYGGGASMKQTSAGLDLTNIRDDEDEKRGVWGMDIFKGATEASPLKNILGNLFGGKKKEEEK